MRSAATRPVGEAWVLSAAKSLSGDSNRLKLEVGKFLNSVRALSIRCLNLRLPSGLLSYPHTGHEFTLWT